MTEADWWEETGQQRGRLVSDELWREYQALRARAQAIEEEMSALPWRDDRVLTAEQREEERRMAEWFLGLVPPATPLRNAVPRAPKS